MGLIKPTEQWEYLGHLTLVWDLERIQLQFGTHITILYITWPFVVFAGSVGKARSLPVQQQEPRGGVLPGLQGTKQKTRLHAS
jgi:hypothetical protein